MRLNPTEGHIIAGAKIDEFRFVGRLRAGQLFQIAPDPRDTEIKKKVDASHELQELLTIRQKVQRHFEGAKKKNVPSYADYILAVRKGEDGLTPVITLYCEEALKVEESDQGYAFIQIPWRQRLVAIDGETQLAARYEAFNKDPSTADDFVPIYLCHGKDEHWAQQCFHDLNTLAVRPNAALSIGMDARDPITRICREVERRVPFFSGRVNRNRRQLRTTDTEITTIAALRGACVTLAKGINGVQFGARPVPIDSQALPAIEATALAWFKHLADAIGPALEDRQNSLASSPAVLVALGALGNQALHVDDERREAKCHQLAQELKAVNWARGKHWEGIAGKFTPKGVLSLGGPKENSYAIYAALTDANSEGYARIRGSAAAEKAA